MTGRDDALIERLLRVIDEGRRTATYKLALLLGLIDAVALRPGESVLPTRLVAEQVLAIYYPQTREFVARHGTHHELRQISMKRSTVVGSVLRLRMLGDAAGLRSARECKRFLPTDFRRALDDIEETFVRYPIPLLQVLGTTVVPFLYELDWPEGTSVRTLRAGSSDRLRLLDGVPDRLAVLGPMLRPLIELHWTRDVARWSRIETNDEALRRHLFGVDRIAFPLALVSGLRDLQGGRCFYCDQRLAARVEVDHFVAWSRWPNDAVENLVLADRCNNAKRDHLAAPFHLHRWRGRLDLRQDELSELATACRWLTDADRSRALATTAYSHVAAGTPLWVRGTEFEVAAGPVTP